MAVKAPTGPAPMTNTFLGRVCSMVGQDKVEMNVNVTKSQLHLVYMMITNLDIFLTRSNHDISSEISRQIAYHIQYISGLRHVRCLPQQLTLPLNACQSLARW